MNLFIQVSLRYDYRWRGRNLGHKTERSTFPEIVFFKSLMLIWSAYLFSFQDWKKKKKAVSNEFLCVLVVAQQEQI